MFIVDDEAVVHVAVVGEVEIDCCEVAAMNVQ